MDGLIVDVTVMVCLPLVPAYVLYRKLPSKTRVRGLFKGLNINLSGAFSAYFLVLLFVGGYFTAQQADVGLRNENQRLKRQVAALNGKNSDLTNQLNGFEVYTLSGQIKFDQPKHDAYQDVRLSIEPPNTTVGPDGWFMFEVPAPLGQAGDVVLPATLYVDGGPDYESESVSLNPNVQTGSRRYTIVRDDVHKVVRVDEQILLRRRNNPPYVPSQGFVPMQ